MATQLALWLTVGLVALAPELTAGQDALPGFPNPPTAKACAQYIGALHAHHSELNKEKLACLKTSTQFGLGVECSFSTLQVDPSYHAWNQCFNKEPEKCMVLSRLKDAARCTLQLSDLVQKEMSDIRSGSAALEQANSLFDNPRKFVFEWVKGASTDVVLRELRAGNAQLSPATITSLGEAYDLIFRQTIEGTQALATGNPIIAAIQQDSFQRIRSAHLQMLSQGEQLTRDMDRFSATVAAAAPDGSQQDLPRQSSRQRLPPAGDAECSLLEGPKRADLIEDDPAKFDRLMARCK